MEKSVKYSITVLLVFFLIIISCKREELTPFYLGVGEYTGEYFPNESWRMCKPESVGVSSDKLLNVYEYVSNTNINTEGVIVIKRGYIIFEAYFRGYSKNVRHESYSIAKSFSSALLGIALDKGLINSIDEKIVKYYPELTTQGTDQRKRRISVRDLLSMMSGISWKEEGEYSHDEDDAFLMMDHEDYIKYVLDKPMRYEPGKIWYYSSGDSMLLSGIIEKSTGMSVFDFGKKYLFNRIGLPDIEWDSDPSGHTITAWGIHATTREFAKFGYLYLKKGVWNDERIVSEKWINDSLVPVAPPEINFYGFQWWLGNSFENYSFYTLPDDIFLAWGLYTQQLFVIPSHDLVIVRLGRDPYDSHDQWDEAEFISLILNSEN